MNILVVGCGKTGAQLANLLWRKGHSISVIDRKPKNFENLDSNFSGLTTPGIPIDLDTLKKAGIEGCDAIAIITSDDNVNLTVAQIAKKIFSVKHVVARIQDPLRRKLYSDYDFFTVCSTSITVASMETALIKNKVEAINFGQTTINFSKENLPKTYISRNVAEYKSGKSKLLFGILHENGLITTFDKFSNYIFLNGDKLILMDVV
ncbi:MAG: TrkA family potassium uptake protein [Oscillospiraceae bacterium]|nr:TrkA family potassium uptake protein [Oscillospiraceae bacterium]